LTSTSLFSSGRIAWAVPSVEPSSTKTSSVRVPSLVDSRTQRSTLPISLWQGITTETEYSRRFGGTFRATRSWVEPR